MLENLPFANWADDSLRAVVDVGSNSIILVIAKKVNGYWMIVFESTRVTGLGKGTKNSGLLNDEAIYTSLNALREFREIAVSHGVKSLESFGTMALRIARNTDEFLNKALKQGTPVTVISGDFEARLGLDAVANDSKFNFNNVFSIVDPGGHSTEIVTAQKHFHQPAGAIFAEESLEIIQQMSVPVGALGLRENILSNPSPSISDRFKASNYLDDMLEERLVQKSHGPVVVLGATGTNLVSIREKLTEWRPEIVHGAYLDYEEISRSVGWMSDLNDEGRSQIVGIEPGREKTLHIGLIILERSLYALKAEGCLVSVKGWRHAMLDHGSI